MSLFIAMPIHGKPEPDTMMSCIALESGLQKTGPEGLPHNWMMITGESRVHRARNNATAAFMAGPWNVLFFIDADISFVPSDFTALWNMMAKGADVACGCYPIKEFGAPFAALKDGRRITVERLSEETEPFPVDGAGTGFMMIHRRVFQRLMKLHPDWKYDDGHQDFWAFFQTCVEDGQDVPEDFWFCRRVREAGMTVWLNPAVRLGHWGSMEFRR